MIYINTVYADHIEAAAQDPNYKSSLSAQDQRMLDEALQRLHRQGLAIDAGQIGDEPQLTRCEATRVWCFCVPIGTKKNQKKVRKTLAS